MEILWWLAPSAVVTLGAMTWVSWTARDRRTDVDRDVAVERLARALSKDHPHSHHARTGRAPDRSTGIAVRPTRQQPATESTRRVS